MATIFSRIIDGELPADFVWKDDDCVAFLSNRPLRPGHTLVVPRAATDHWIDLEPGLLAHLAATAQTIGKAQMAAFKPGKIGLMLVGLEVLDVGTVCDGGTGHRRVPCFRTGNADPSKSCIGCARKRHCAGHGLGL